MPELICFEIGKISISLCNSEEISWKVISVLSEALFSSCYFILYTVLLGPRCGGRGWSSIAYRVFLSYIQWSEVEIHLENHLLSG